MFYPLRWVFYEKLLTIHEFHGNDIVGNDDDDDDDVTMDGLLMGCSHGLHSKFRETSLHTTLLLHFLIALQEHAKSVMLDSLPFSCDVLCTHPMFGPESGKYGWQGLPFLYDKVRIEDTVR